MAYNPQNRQYQGEQFEVIVAEILKEYGFEVTHLGLSSRHCYDIHAEKNDIKLAVEVKFSKRKNIHNNFYDRSVNDLVRITQDEGITPVLIVSSVLSDEIEPNQDVIYCDIRTLLFLTQGMDDLYSRLVSIFDFTVEDIEIKEPDPRLDISSPKIIINDYSSLKTKLKNWKSFGKVDAPCFEKLCFNALKALFSEDLSLWKMQQNSNQQLYRFDLICKIKNSINKEFWNMSERYFYTKYIIFEFKNYTEEITQKEIYTTEKYLYAKGLRNIAIIISTKGSDENANKAVRGILRENGKVIISLTKEDLVSMLDYRLDDKDPSDFLSDKLDELLIELEK